jgi:hypothetical protein
MAEFRSQKDGLGMAPSSPKAAIPNCGPRAKRLTLQAFASAVGRLVGAHLANAQNAVCAPRHPCASYGSRDERRLAGPEADIGIAASGAQETP